MIGNLTLLDTWLIILTTVAALQVIRYAVNAINNMDYHTSFPIRFAYIVLASAGAAIILCPAFYKTAPQHSEAALLIAVAILTFCDRRKSTST